MSDTALMTEIIRSDAKRICSAVDLRPLANKTILVTGGTGIIGTHILAALECAIKNGIAIRDVTFTSTKHELPANISQIARQFNHRIVDFGCFHSVSGYLGHFDCIIHAAGYGQPGKFTAAPNATISINTHAVYDLNWHLSDGGKFLYSSSSELYSGGVPPYHENEIGQTSPQHPRGCYIEGKRCGEAICHALNKGHRGNEFKVARISLGYGPGTREGDERVMYQFIHKALTTKMIVMKDAGLAHRTYCYITDVVENLFNILLYGKEEVYNVGGTSHCSIRQLAQHIAHWTGAEVVAPEIQSQAFDSAPQDVEMNLDKTRKEFHKTDYVPLELGLPRTITYLKALYGV